jgi:hypothetical protein
MTKNELRDGIIALLRESGLGIDEKIKAISEARGEISVRLPSLEKWRDSRKPLVRKGKEKGDK